MVGSGNPSAGQSSSPSLDGAFMSAQQLLDLVKNQEFIYALSKNPEMVLPLKLEVSFNRLWMLLFFMERLVKEVFVILGLPRRGILHSSALTPIRE